MPTRIPERQSRNEQMAQDYRDGKTITWIAAAYGLSLSWTGRILRQQGIAMPPVRQGVKRKLNVAQVVRDYQHGATIQTVADTHHASYGTIRRLLLREKVAIRPHGGQNAITPAARCQPPPPVAGGETGKPHRRGTGPRKSDVDSSARTWTYS
ncbi:MULTISPECIES: helix-turn-helix domain-containing protein [Amycolatopsis]|nr:MULTISPECIES: hypothetical protein [Amycolatopsis]